MVWYELNTYDITMFLFCHLIRSIIDSTKLPLALGQIVQMCVRVCVCVHERDIAVQVRQAPHGQDQTGNKQVDLQNKAI